MSNLNTLVEVEKIGPNEYTVTIFETDGFVSTDRHTAESIVRLLETHPDAVFRMKTTDNRRRPNQPPFKVGDLCHWCAELSTYFHETASNPDRLAELAEALRDGDVQRRLPDGERALTVLRDYMLAVAELQRNDRRLH